MNQTASTVELTREEIVARLTAGARRRLLMTPEEMVNAYRAGALLDPGRVADLLALASLLRRDDPLFAKLANAELARPASV